MRILILANGESPPRLLLEKLLSRCDYYIATDGAGNTTSMLGIPADLIIGDLDSYRTEAAYQGRMIHDPDQETNDLEKALHHAASMNATRVDVLGASGGRLDHTLKNLSVLQQMNNRFDRLAFFDQTLYSRILPQDFSISLPPDHLVSLFPLSGKVTGITTSGLTFPLHDEDLENGRRDGSSNKTQDGDIRIQHTSGTLLFMTKLTDQLF